MATKSSRKFSFRVRVGRHIGSKHDGPDEAGKVYTAGQVVHTNTDLIARHGPEKFELIKGPPDAAKERSVVDPRSNSFPGGQVHDGRQQSLGKDEEGNPLSGPIMPGDEADENEKEVNDDDEDRNESSGDEGVEVATPDELKSMTIKELREYAGEHAIDIAHVSGKDNIIKTILAAGGDDD